MVNVTLRSKWWRFGFRSSVMLYFILLVVVPVIGIYGQSLSRGLGPFIDSLTNPLAWRAVLLSLRLALFAALFNTVLGTWIAWVLTRYRFFGRGFLNSLVDLPFALPAAIGGLMILLLLGPQSLVGRAADKLGLVIVFHEPAIVLAMMFVTFPFVIRAVQPLLEEIDKSEEEASCLLGASRTATFLKVIIPSIRPGIISGAMLAFSRALAEFGAVVLIAGNIPGKTLLASVYIFGEVESYNEQGAAAVSVMLLTLSFLILWSVNLLQARGRKA